MNTVYPDKNPFPYQGTMTVEASSDFDSDESYQIPRTLPLEPVRQTLGLVRDYIERFQLDQIKRGQFAVLRGDHGSGKTHAIKYVIDRVKQDIATANSGVCRPILLYGQGKKPDFLAIYKQLVSQLPIEDLQDINLRFLGVVASEQIGRNATNRAAELEVAAKLREEPAKVYELFKSYLVERGAVEEKAKSEVRKLSPGTGDDFRRAFSYMLSPELARAAYQWLLAQPITDEEKRRLGVSGPIISAEVSTMALQLLASLFNRVGRPLVIFIDQYEKLITTKDKVLAAGNAGLIHSLVEIVPRENGMFVLSGNEEAWDALPRDLESRFAGNVVDFPVLKPEEASEMILLYLTAAEDPFSVHMKTVSRPRSPGEFYPFDDDAIRKIISYSAGNIRNLLQICSKVFDAAAANKREITTRLVDKVLREGKLAYYSRENVVAEIERILRERSLTYQRDFRIGQVEVDLAVITAENHPQVLIEINEAAFHEQEAQRALATLNIVQSIRQQGLRTPIVFVALGYVSEEVTKAVREFSQDFIVYKPRVFRSRMRKVLNRILAREVPRRDSQKDVATLETRLHDLSAKLERLLSERKAEADVTEQRLAELFERQAMDRLRERRQGARPAWADERRRIEREIQEIRKQRSQLDLHEMERLRERAEHDRRRRGWIQSVLVLLPSIGFFVYVFALQLRFERDFWYSFSRTLSVPLVIGSLFVSLLLAALVLLRARGVIGPALYRDIAGPVSSSDELQRLTQQYLAERRRGWSSLHLVMSRYRTALTAMVNPFPTGIVSLLRSSNPHYRFVGALAADPQRHHELLMHVLKVERSAIVRRKIAQQVGRGTDDLERFEDLLSGFITELAYIIDAGQSPRSIPYDWPNSLRTLANMHGAYYGLSSNSLAAILAAGDHEYYDKQGLVRIFHVGLDRSDPKDLSEVTEARIRQALNDLSPYDEGGLGTFDELSVINKVDEYYLFFRQLLFFVEREVLLLSSVNN